MVSRFRPLSAREERALAKAGKRLPHTAFWRCARLSTGYASLSTGTSLCVWLR